MKTKNLEAQLAEKKHPGSRIHEKARASQTVRVQKKHEMIWVARKSIYKQ
jgi:hypothetical protein